MEAFPYRDGQLYCEDVPIGRLADQFGTPLFVYSQNAILGTLNALKSAFAEVEPLLHRWRPRSAGSYRGQPDGFVIAVDPGDLESTVVRVS